jgi:hypothetical protein
MSPSLPVSKISSSMVPEDCFFDIDVAEKLALITENRRMQIAFVPPKYQKGYIFFHNMTSMAQLLKIENLAFKEDINPTEEIQRLKRVDVV